MNEESDIADREFRHFTDFLVAEVALEFEIDDLALILG
jgi:hypothetical protein